jgi:sarcosine oxidase, subunit gamma
MRDLALERLQPSSAVIPQTLEPVSPATRFVLRGGEAVRGAASAALGFPLPQEVCRAATSQQRACLWQGPDEWLILGPDADAALGSDLGNALASLPHSLVDVSHRQVGLSVTGPKATLLLASGIALDLGERSFPVNMCTRTMLAKAEVVLWRTAPQAFRLEVWRSFASYVSEFLTEAARGII